MPNPSRDLSQQPVPVTAGTDSRLLLLFEGDNVFVARMRIRAGETVLVEGNGVTLAADLPLGHKLARRPIAAGEKIVKYGAPIGTATEAIPVGTPVHVHNVKSDYTPTYHLMDANKAEAGR
ncbi:UxaA family hydrolase [Kaistia granuli]|uniref:UxaA family hydrolase n=1 Tax=Kaistia granuli TaxID=363259 RepID=UPI0006869DF9|nr:UxaA family hydrolase [Kaistia granuli]